MTKENTKGFAAIIFILIVLLLVGGGVFFFVKNSSQKGGNNQPTFEFNTQPEQKESQIPDDWLTYQNPKFNYEIKYHPDFHAQQNNEPPYPPPPTGMSFSRTWDNQEWCSYEILVFTDTDGFGGEIESIRKEGKDIESQATIDGVSAIVFDTMGGEAISRTYYLDKDSKHFRMGYNYKVAGKYSQDCADIVTKMPSSFKFN